MSYAVLAVLVGIGVAAGWLWRSPRLAAGLLVLACAGSVWHVASTPLPSGDASSVVYGLLTVLVPTLVVLVLTFFAVRAVRRPPVVRGSGSAQYLIAISGWLLVVEALPDLDVLFRSNCLCARSGLGGTPRRLVAAGPGLGSGDRLCRTDGRTTKDGARQASNRLGCLSCQVAAVAASAVQ